MLIWKLTRRYNFQDMQPTGCDPPKRHASLIKIFAIVLQAYCNLGSAFMRMKQSQPSGHQTCFLPPQNNLLSSHQSCMEVPVSHLETGDLGVIGGELVSRAKRLGGLVWVMVCLRGCRISIHLQVQLVSRVACVHAKSFSRVLFFATLWTVAHQALLPMQFSRQEHWSESLCPPPGDLPDPGIEPMSLMSPALAAGFFTTSATWEAQ